MLSATVLRRVLIGLVALMMASSPAATAQVPEAPDEFDRLIGNRIGDVGDNDAPPEGDVDPDSPVPNLTRMIDEIAEVAAGPVTPAERASLSRALGHTRDALKHATGESGDIAALIASMHGASLSLDEISPRSSAGEFARDTSTRLAAVGRFAAVQPVDLAERRGADRSAVATARLLIEEGDLAASSGDASKGLVKFGQAYEALPLRVFDPALFEAGIIDRVFEEAVGFSWSISVDGQLERADAVGLSRQSADGGATDQSEAKEMTVASVSKTITGMAVMRALQETGVSVDASISPYLPSNWLRGPGIASLTFRNLMTHTSGLGGQNGQAANTLSQSYNGIRTLIAQGVQAADKTRLYQNVNFGIMRIVIPYLVGQCPACLNLGESLGFNGGMTSLMFQNFLTSRIFDVAGISASCTGSDPLPTRYFFDFTAQEGIDGGDYFSVCGGRGMYFSALDLGAVLAHYRFTNDILSPGSRFAMRSGFLGWNDPAFVGFASGALGTYYGHGGDWRFEGGATSRGLGTCIMDYPGGVQAVLLINSRGGDYANGNASYQCTGLNQAYEDAWVWA